MPVNVTLTKAQARKVRAMLAEEVRMGQRRALGARPALLVLMAFDPQSLEPADPWEPADEPA